MEARKTFFNLPEDKRNRVLETAIREFSEKGYERASINEIVARLGIAKGSIYQYFNNKRSLFLHTFDHAVDLVRKTLKQVKAETKDDPVFERIRKSLLAGVDFIDRHPLIYGIYLRMVYGREAPFREELLQKIRLFSAEYLHSLLLQGRARGEIRKDIDMKAAVFLLDAVMDRFLQAHALAFLDSAGRIWDRERPELEQFVDDIVEVLRKGLSA
ncbi:MAG: TetR/AcrR family transcriptional regulator [Acidobacteriota bacterium]